MADRGPMAVQVWFLDGHTEVFEGLWAIKSGDNSLEVLEDDGWRVIPFVNVASWRQVYR